MKATEAPEKIYVQLPSRNWIGKTWNETPIKDGDNPNWKNATNIEYTRTDAFLNKACDWMDEHCKLLTSKDYEDFKTYMKGE